MLPEFTEFELSSGTWALFSQNRSDVFAMDIQVNFGSAFELNREAGIAHFLEHMFFSGTKRLSRKQITGRIDSVGGTINAFTTRENIQYYIKVRGENSMLAMNTLFDCFNNCEFFENELELERKIILNEIRDMRDNPVKRTLSEFVKLCLSGSYARPIIGSEKTVSSFKRRDLINAFKKSHFAGNTTVSISAPGSAKKYISILEELLPKSKKGNLKLKKCRARPKSKTKVLEKEVEQAHFCIGFPAVGSSSEDYAVVSLIEAILGGGLSSRIVYEVREKRGLSYIVQPFFDSEPRHGYFAVYLATTPEKVEGAKSVVLKEFARIREREVSLKELKKAKQHILGTKTLDWEDSLERVKDSIFAKRSGWSWREYFKKIREADAKELRNVAREIVPSDEFCSVLLRPK